MFKPPELNTWIAGISEPSEIEDEGQLVDPNSGKLLQHSRSSSPGQLERAIAAADKAHGEGIWWQTPAAERAVVLEKFAEALNEEIENIATADALNSGVPISITTGFASGLADTVHDVAQRINDRGDFEKLDAGERTVVRRRVPWGPVALILPWNAPSFMVVKKMAYALAAGAPVVIKPSSFSPWSAQYVMRAAQKAGFPAGTVNLVTGSGSMGRMLVADPRIKAISMTGSTPTGKAIASVAGQNLTRLQLELGSNNPAIVLADADIQTTSNKLISGAMKLSGQWCEAPRRVYVDRSKYEDLISELKKELEKQKFGSSLDVESQIGPVAYPARKEELEKQVADLVSQGAEMFTVEGEMNKDGSFVRPTLLWGEGLELKDEIFGPVLTVIPFTDLESTIRLANSGAHGLAAYVFTENETQGRAIATLLDSGENKINGTSVLDMAKNSKQGFYGQSGIGGHGDEDVLDFFTGWRIVGTDAEGLPI